MIIEKRITRQYYNVCGCEDIRARAAAIVRLRLARERGGFDDDIAGGAIARRGKSRSGVGRFDKRNACAAHGRATREAQKRERKEGASQTSRRCKMPSFEGEKSRSQSLSRMRCAKNFFVGVR